MKSRQDVVETLRRRVADRRGFTLLESLAAIGLASLVLGVLASAVSSQGRSAVFQMGAADMQQNVRGALDLFERELRMAGFGMSAVPAAVAAPIQVPTTTGGDVYEVVLRGNYANATSRGSASAGSTTITLDATAAPFPTFTVGQQVAIESALLGTAEIRTITGWNLATRVISVAPALVNAYTPGDPVNQINVLRYRLDNQGRFWRNNDLVADQMNILDLNYVLADGSEIENPSTQIANLRAATIQMRTAKDVHAGRVTPQARLETEVRIRNLGLVREAGAGA